VSGEGDSCARAGKAGGVRRIEKTIKFTGQKNGFAAVGAAPYFSFSSFMVCETGSFNCVFIFIFSICVISMLVL